MRLRNFTICVCGLLLLGTSAFAASAKKASSSPKTTAQGVEKIIAGPVALVNIEKKEIAIERNGKQYPIFIDGSTSITAGNNPIALENIKTGDMVSVSYQKSSDGKRIALTISNKSSSGTVTPKSSMKSKAEKKEVVMPKAAAATPASIPKAEVRAVSKKEAAPIIKTEPVAAPKVEAKAEPKKEPAVAAKAASPAVAPKAEAKADSKKDTTSAAKAVAAPAAAPKKEPVAAQ
jgi:hypothetical protein